MELRVLSQTGLVGALLAVVGLIAALIAGARALRSARPLVGDVAAAALAGFAYWAVHGSLDWLWEFAGLGAPAFAFLGIACALAPARGAGGAGAAGRTPPGRPARAARLLAIVALLVAACVSLATPWLSQLQVERAAHVWRTNPAAAYARLSDAARLNPLSDEADVVAGSIAVRRDELGRADGQFAKALSRTPGDAYATLERGAIASSKGRRAAAVALLERAVYLNPREGLPHEVLEAVGRGVRIDVPELNEAILLKAQKF